MQIGNLSIKGYTALAPMAGLGDRAFRELCKSYGCAFVTGEMASAKGLTLSGRKTAELLRLSEMERPAAVQLFGSEPETMGEAARMALSFQPDCIDINMGCPAPKVTSSGGGCALMKDEDLAVDIAAAVKKAVGGRCPVTAKMRAGWDEQNINAVSLARRLEGVGVDAITVHGRTRGQMYAPPVNVAVIREVKEAVAIPVIGNGDIRAPQDAKHMREATGCDMVMVGRGALGAPWIFGQIEHYLSTGELLPAPPLFERMEIMLRHVEAMCRYKGEYTAMREARAHIPHYFAGLHGAAALRREAASLSTLEEAKRLADKVVTISGKAADR